ncbi:MAG TPA: transposase [Acidobacteriaceae bacterium]
MAAQQSNTYAISISTFLQHRHFQKPANADLFLKTLLRYRSYGKFHLHGFAIMPDHIHLLITPASDQSLPKCMQLIKGGYSFSASTIIRKEIWHSSYREHRIRDLSDYDNQLRYIANNPPAGRLPPDYLYLHTHPDHASLIDPCPPYLLE